MNSSGSWPWCAIVAECGARPGVRARCESHMSAETDAVVLSTENLNLSYGNVQAVENLNLRVHRGEIYGFLGRNGAGKTSTIRMLMGIVRPDAGLIRMLDFAGRRIGVKEKRHIG